MLDPETAPPEPTRRASDAVPKVQCPACTSWISRVKDGRPVADGYRRKRKCRQCEAIFTTTERAD